MAFSASIDLGALDGTTGFRLNGVAASDQSGYSVASAGDVNGDGYDDLIVGAPAADPNGSASGASYVVFGKASGFGASVELSTLDGTTGFRLNGAVATDNSGRSVASAGDVNGDGYDDLIVGAPAADLNGSDSGTSYVMFGKASGFAASVELSTLDGTTGFRLNGAAGGDNSGRSVASAGDVNGDGIDDLIVGAWQADPNGSGSGASYVVFGKASGFGTSVELSTLDGTTGFVLNGAAAGDNSGRSVASAGDVNGDGYDDLIVGAWQADPNGSSSGASYVVFGKASGFSASVELSTLDGTTGFRLNGAAGGDNSGVSVASAGDVNGDGYDDLIVGAPGADPNGSASGTSYVVFGQASGFAASVDLSTLDGTTGFRLNGAAASDQSGRSVASAGDVNGDGYDDLIVGAPAADLNGSDSGASYVMFGKASGFAASVELSTLDGTTGFRLNGAAGGDNSGRSVASAGDVNGDGYDDLIVGAETADPNSLLNAGVSYVVFGRAGATAGSPGADRLVGTADDDTLYGLGGNDTLIGGAGADLMIGGGGNDRYRVADAGDVVVETAGGGIDTVYTTLSSYTLGADVENLRSVGPGGFAGTGNELANILAGGSGDDTLLGEGGDDRLVGGGGADLMTGGGGNDLYSVTDTGDVVVEAAGGGIDTVYTTLSSYLLGADVENLWYVGPGGFDGTGNELANVLAGGAGDDTLDGGLGRDALNGGEGSDVLIGGQAADKLMGGAGADVFVFRDALDSTRGSRDTILDFTVGTDSIDFTQMASGGGFHALQTVTSVPATIDAHSLVALVGANGNTVLYVNDTDVAQATKSASMEILLKGVTTLGDADLGYFLI